MKYYVIDTTIEKNPIFFNSLNEVVNHLEKTCTRLTGTSRREFMLNRVDLGHPADESSGRNFIEGMREYLNIGVVKQNTLVNCNISDVEHYSKYVDEMGH